MGRRGIRHASMEMCVPKVVAVFVLPARYTDQLLDCFILHVLLKSVRSWQSHPLLLERRAMGWGMARALADTALLPPSSCLPAYVRACRWMLGGGSAVQPLQSAASLEPELEEGVLRQVDAACMHAGEAAACPGQLLVRCTHLSVCFKPVCFKHHRFRP